MQAYVNWITVDFGKAIKTFHPLDSGGLWLSKFQKKGLKTTKLGASFWMSKSEKVKKLKRQKENAQQQQQQQSESLHQQCGLFVTNAGYSKLSIINKTTNNLLKARAHLITDNHVESSSNIA